MTGADQFREHPRAHQRPMLALGLRLGSAAMFSILLVLVKLAGERRVWLPEIMIWRQLIPGILLLGWLVARGRLVALRTARRRDHARRAAIGVVGMFLSFGVVLLLPLAEATVLSFTAPIFAVLLSMLVLREKVGPWRLGAVMLGLIGVVIMVNPGHVQLPWLGLLVGIGAAFMVSVIAIQLRDLGHTESPVTIVFYFSAFSVPLLMLALPFAPTSHAAPLHHDALTWLILFGVGVFGLFTQLLMTAALRFGPVSSVIVMDYSTFGWSLLWGWLVFDHLPPASTWLGAPAIIAAGAIIAWREHVLSKRRQLT